ncbi:ATP-binding protein [Streptomyces sp. NPDC060002]|uniref:ATP-binding protein n=1 Tax=Streptomyces sp. NPDC060002 TaxID=3347033 RepID=UPI0036A6B958
MLGCVTTTAADRCRRREFLGPDTTFSAELIISELVTNAIRYGGDGPFRLRLVLDTVLTCEVSDTNETQPRLRRARLTDEGGRGP